MPLTSIFATLALASPLTAPQTTPPVLWLHPDGYVLVNGKPVDSRITKGASGANTPLGRGLALDGTSGGMLLKDRPEFKLTKSITVSTWIYLRSYWNDGPGAQVLFRGDDRDGLDPYDLVVHGGGTIHFSIEDGKTGGMDVKAEIPLQRWTHVVGSFDNQTGGLKMWLNGELVGTARTSKRPFAELVPAYTPGIGIGNIQNQGGSANQPLNGTVVDLRVYDRVVEPLEAGYRSTPLTANSG